MYIYITHVFYSYIHITMKKLLICALCTTILFAWAFVANAKENYATRTNKIVKERVWWKTCDVNKNGKTDIDDITRIIDYCYLNWMSSDKCDLNRNWKLNIEDVSYFYDVCYSEILNQPKTNNQVIRTKVQQVSRVVNVKANRNNKLMPLKRR